MTQQDDTIIFEQPLNELMRLCLRLEHLFQQITQHIHNHSSWGSRITLTAILEVLSLIDRPDLKTKLTKILSKQISTLSQLEQVPNVDKQKLQHTLIRLEQMIDSFYANPGKIGQKLRETEFLNTVRLQLANPGGASAFSTPVYHLWLHQPAEKRSRELARWFKELELIRATVNLILELTRESTLPTQEKATMGFFQLGLLPNITHQLIKVYLPLHLNVYPEISVGRHRLAIRFMDSTIEGPGRSRQYLRDLPFSLACCRL